MKIDPWIDLWKQKLCCHLKLLSQGFSCWGDEIRFVRGNVCILPCSKLTLMRSGILGSSYDGHMSIHLLHGMTHSFPQTKRISSPQQLYFLGDCVNSDRETFCSVLQSLPHFMRYSSSQFLKMMRMHLILHNVQFGKKNWTKKCCHIAIIFFQLVCV